ncbi:O-methyltransferase [Dinghuibacter silviterrae]|uniref:Putative O-methyltransferase YrrM n=1 Tax=Dinghuibacter silviterrae TaxID=1539049 RepID=A0A4R8DPF5_9BACT|nr:O-methyltransferase [Dinghuibacter silviterrae]TDW99176.1 putative O-methyltransferase YrrM [Dinghuibacter silviterrae]
MEFIHPLGAAYAERFSSRETPLLQEIAEFTRTHHAQAHMLSGRAQGAFLSFISKIVRPRRVLEIGTFTGYSALCLAEGLAPDGELHTLEVRKEEADIALGYFARSPWRDRIILHEGNALDSLDRLTETWDLVFIDADKTAYIAYYEAVLPNLRPGGVVLADNVLFHGEVLEEPVRGKNALAIQAFNEHVAADQRVSHALVPMRDGMMCVYKN